MTLTCYNSKGENKSIKEIILKSLNKTMKEDIKEKCDYCEEEAKYHQIFEIGDIKTGKIEIVWERSACETHKDHSED